MMNFNYIDTFYPTNEKMFDVMRKYLKKDYKYILEPSAGKGNIVDYLNKYYKFDIDVIEIDKNLQSVLKDNNKCHLVYDDFLNFYTLKNYDLIIMNPPFDEGAKHLLKAISLQNNGGDIICILNAETLRNPYSNERKHLLHLLEKYNANIEYVENGFSNAERKTNVETAVIYISIEKQTIKSSILEEMKKAKEVDEKDNPNHVMSGNWIEQLIETFNFEAKAGIKLIDEYNSVCPYLDSSLNDTDYSTNIIKMKFHDSNGGYGVTKNEFLKRVRRKYWRGLFNNANFTKLLTNELKANYVNMIEKLDCYDFNMFNIQKILKDLDLNMVKGVESTILKLFDELSYQHAYTDTNNNRSIHYYNGWKTNKAYKVNDRVIISSYGVFEKYSFMDSYDIREYKAFNILSEIEKVFNYLNNGKVDSDIDLQQVVRKGYTEEFGNWIDCKYFKARFYKKGTCHIKFKNKELLEKFNLYGSLKKGWLPDSYGKKAYNDMTQEEKDVIDEFQGEKEYNKVLSEKDFYLEEKSSMLALPNV